MNFHKSINVNFRDGLYPAPSVVAGKIHSVRGPFRRWTGQRSESIEECFNFYTPIVKAYHAAGIKVIFVIGPEAWGDGGVTGGQPPWIPGGISWLEYSRQIAAVTLQIVRHYAAMGIEVIIQTFNEPDTLGIIVDYNRDTSKERFSAIPFSAHHYALMAATIIRVVRADFPKIQIFAAGLCTGAQAQGLYWEAVTKALGGELDVNAFSTHPYTIFPKTRPAIRGLWTASMSTHFNILRRYTSLPMFVSEIGVAADVAFPESDYANIAIYMKECYEWLRDNQVIGMSWWAWHDGMVNGGLLNAMGQIKAFIYNMFMSLGQGVVPTVVSNAVTTDVLLVRSGRSTNCKQIGKIPARTAVQVLDCLKPTGELDATAFGYKTASADEWVAIQHGTGRGYVSAPYLTLR